MTMHMWWHKCGEWENMQWYKHFYKKEVMVHLSDGDVWNALQNFDPKLAKDARNIRIGLVIDGFTPFCENVTSYTCWSVFVVPYNLPPCMKYELVFLCPIIPGLDHSRPKLNMMLKPFVTPPSQNDRR
jgi:hypothetical protein